MRNGTTPPSNTILKQDKGTTHINQLQTIFYFLKDHIATASMVTDATGVPQKCITRYKRDLEKAEMLWEIEKKDCKKTGFKAWYLTTDPNKAPKRLTSQLDLFESTTAKPEPQKEYKLHERITLEGAHMEVDRCTAFKLLTIQPFQWDNRRHAAWPKVFEGSLEECDAFVETLINQEP